MRALILSDIHANLDALEAVLTAAPAHDTVWNLGDCVGYGACPNEVIERVRALGEVFVRGNHDRACAGLTSVEDFNPVAAQAVAWTRRTLTPEHTAWLRDLPRGPLTVGEGVSCMHGSPLDEDEYVVSLRDAMHALRGSGERVNFFGHTHVQGGFATDGEDWFELLPQFENTADTEEHVLKLRSGGRYLLNPGSVGQPRDQDWRAGFAVYDDAAVAVSFYRAPYNVERAQQRIRGAGLPDRLASRLLRGI